MIAFLLLSLSVFDYGPTTLAGPGYLAVIVLGEVVDRLTRVLAVVQRCIGQRRDD